jgi:hypothetical protein
LALAVECKGALVALVSSKLFGGCNHGDSFAIPNEDGAFTGRDEDGAIFTVIDVKIGSDVEYEEGAVPALVDVVLLLFN